MGKKTTNAVPVELATVEIAGHTYTMRPYDLALQIAMSTVFEEAYIRATEKTKNPPELGKWVMTITRDGAKHPDYVEYLACCADVLFAPSSKAPSLGAVLREQRDRPGDEVTIGMADVMTVNAALGFFYMKEQQRSERSQASPAVSTSNPDAAPNTATGRRLKTTSRKSTETSDGSPGPVNQPQTSPP